MDSLSAITPLDGRYRERIAGLAKFVSEGALVRYRLKVECEWLLHLAELPEIAPALALSPVARGELARAMVSDDGTIERRVKELEKTTNHDVKAVEYAMRERLSAAGVTPAAQAFIHFACTSEDINNLAYALMLRDLRDHRFLPHLDRVIEALALAADTHAALPMLSRTHGQTASPTTLGKELAVFGHRLLRQRQRLATQGIEGKINGAVGNYNAHVSAYAQLDWRKIAKSFVLTRLGLAFNPLTTQIENHDSLVETIEILRHANTILIGLCRDVWSYISIGYFTQRAVAGEIGSSTMPHKVNPIDFENAEGNFGLANALCTHFGDKLPISRWQRDLSDSTVLRALGEIAGHTELALASLLKGLSKIEAAPARLAADLDDAWEVLAEPIQTVMRRYGVLDAYERLKAATRGRIVTRAALQELVRGSKELPEAAKTSLLGLTPAAYVGLAPELARDFAATARALVRP